MGAFGSIMMIPISIPCLGLGSFHSPLKAEIDSTAVQLVRTSKPLTPVGALLQLEAGVKHLSAC